MSTTQASAFARISSHACAAYEEHNNLPCDAFPASVIEPLVEQVIFAPGAEFPSAGGLTTGADLHRFAEMLRRGGELDGVRVLSPAMIRLAARNWAGDKPNTVWDPIPTA